MEQPMLQTEPVTPLPKPNPKDRTLHLLRSIFGWIETFVLTLGVLLLVLTFVGRYAPVEGSSMNPTLQDGDLVLLSGLGYTPKQGDVVVVQSKSYGYEKPLVKRIIAKGGQTVTLDYENWRVIVDGVVVEEPYILKESDPMRTGDPYQTDLSPNTFTVPEGELFVMGDNRNGSADSRDPRIGYIDERLVIGKVYFRIFPWSSFGAIDGTQ